MKTQTKNDIYKKKVIVEVFNDVSELGLIIYLLGLHYFIVT